MSEETDRSSKGASDQPAAASAVADEPDFLFLKFLSTLFLVLAFVCVAAGAWIIVDGVKVHNDLLFFYGLILGVAGSLTLLFFASAIRLLINIAVDVYATRQLAERE